MKRIIRTAAIAVILLLLPFMANAKGTRMLSDLSKLPDVESVYISQAAFRLTGNADIMGIDPSVLKNIRSMEILETSNASSRQAMEKKAGELMERLGLEVLVEAKDKEDITVVYGKVPETDSGSGLVESVLIMTGDSKESTLIFIDGKININDITNAVNKKEK